MKELPAVVFRFSKLQKKAYFWTRLRKRVIERRFTQLSWSIAYYEHIAANGA
jgi:hypothetical protein